MTPMPPVITGFANSPDRGRGHARDMRLRWAFEEAGVPYDVRLLSFAEMKEEAHLKLHPFGQIPTYEEDGSGEEEGSRSDPRMGRSPLDPRETGAQGLSWGATRVAQNLYKNHIGTIPGS